MKRAVPANLIELAAAMQRIRRDAVPRYCGVTNCAREHAAMNLCRAHYQKAWKALGPAGYTHTEYPQPDLLALAVEKVGSNGFTTKMVRPCVVPGCEGKWFGRGFCEKHYMAWYRLNRKERNGQL